MRLLYFNKIHTNAPWGAETFLNASLWELGLETRCVDYEENKYALARYLQKLNGEFDALLLQRGTGYLLPSSVLRAMNRPRFFVFTELVARHPKQHYLFQDRLFDHVFLRSLACIDYVTRKGWLLPEQVSLLRSAVRPDFHHPIANLDKDIDVLFVGSLLPRRQAILKRLGQDFNIVTLSVFGSDMVEVVNRAKIVLNLHAEDHLDTETRLYEVLACKGFLITEKLSAESPFTHGTHLVEASDLDDLAHNIRYFLEHPEQRQSIAEAGYRLVINNHTYDAQAKQIAVTLENYVPETPSNESLLDYELLRRAAFQERANHLFQRLTFVPRRAVYKARQALSKDR